MSDTPVIDYGTKARKNLAAAASLVFGLMLFVPLAGVAAIIFGRRGMRAARDRVVGGYRMARAGAVLGAVNVILTVIVATAYGVREYRASRQRLCANNLKQIGLAILYYTNENRGRYPPTFDHLVITNQLPPGSPVFACPNCAGGAKKPAWVGTVVTSNYILAPEPMPWLKWGMIPTDLVVAFEPLSNHDGRGMNVLLGDGHVEWLDAALAARVLTEIRSNQNPPPSLLNR